MTNEPDKRCGTCRWWKWFGIRTSFGECSYPLPKALVKDMDDTREDEGADCPCWQKKEEAQP